MWFGIESTVPIGPPGFFATVLTGLGVLPTNTVMGGDDVESDAGGALRASLLGVLVRTGKYRPEAVAASGVESTVTVDSVADVPARLGALGDGVQVCKP